MYIKARPKVWRSMENSFEDKTIFWMKFKSLFEAVKPQQYGLMFGRSSSVISQCHFSIYVGFEVDGCYSKRTFSPLILLIVFHSFECKSAFGNCHITLCMLCMHVFVCVYVSVCACAFEVWQFSLFCCFLFPQLCTKKRYANVWSRNCRISI